MKILIDLQALQTESADRGIGRYVSSLTLELIDQLSEHEICILLHDIDNQKEDTKILKSIKDKIGDKHTIRFPLTGLDSPALYLKDDGVRLSKILREHFIEALAPDIVLITSLFEFDALSTIPIAADRSYFCAVILYDLIPLSDPENYLPNTILKNWYADRLKQLKQADALLAISEYVRLDALKRLELTNSSIKNISAGTSIGNFKNCRQSGLNLNLSDNILENKPYVFYVGGFDKRKNLEGLVSAFAKLPSSIKDKYCLVLAGKISNSRRFEIENFVKKSNLSSGKVIIYGFIDDEKLIDFYKNAYLFVYPSTDEGFGLPPLEAMTFGVPTITSNCASLPEVVGNEEALFDPFNESDFLYKLEKGLINETYRSLLVSRGLEQSLRFSWKISAHTATSFILERFSMFVPGKACIYLSFRHFVDKTFDKYDIKLTKVNYFDLENLLTKALVTSADADPEKPILAALELNVSEMFSLSIPDYSSTAAPYVFSSMLCREQHFHLPLYTYWCRLLKEIPRFHRKQWEFVYICQALYERGYLREGLSSIGFGVGKEPLVSYFASCGVKVLATDLDLLKAIELGWVSTDQHSNNLDVLNELELCDSHKFNDLVRFMNVDMNHIPTDIGSFDFCWSSCAFEHLGSIRKGLDFVLNSARLLKPGGIAVHTTEYNISSNSKTLDNNPSFVIFRRCDIELLFDELKSEGYQVEPIDFSSGEDELERYVDLPPYLDEPHLRLQLAGEYVSTSLGIIVRAPKTDT